MRLSKKAASFYLLKMQLMFLNPIIALEIRNEGSNKR
jgi:hypothetical protein